MYDTSGVRTLSMLLHHLFLPYAGTFHPAGRKSDQIRQEVLCLMFCRKIISITARAKGSLEGRVLFKHALQNAFIPIITRIGMMIPFLVGGAVVTEQIFAWPGLGSLMVLSINSVIIRLSWVSRFSFTATVLISNMVVDLIMVS